MLSRESVFSSHEDLLFRYLETGSPVDLDVVRALVATDADVNFRGEYGRTPLHLCVLVARNANCADIVETLLEAGADVNARDVCGYTPLHCYVQHDYVQLRVVETMLAAGAEVRTEGGFVFYDNVLSSFLASCGSTGSEADIVRVLIRAGADVRESDAYDMTALHVYARNPAARPDVLGLMLEAGADVRAMDKHGVTPLAVLLSSTGVNDELVAMMLRAGADPRARDMDGRTLLHHLATVPRAKESIMRTLVDSGCDPAGIDTGGNTALHYMAMYGTCRRPVVSFLLEKGLDMDRQNDAGQTALYRAAVFNPAACRRLIQMGADLAPVAATGFCAVAEVFRRNDFKSAAALLERKPPIDLLVRALVTATNWGFFFPDSEAALLCVHSLVARGAGERVRAEPVLGKYADAVRECEAEIRAMREVRCNADTTLLDVLRADESAKAVHVPNALLDRVHAFKVYGNALFGKVCMMRLRMSLAEHVAGLLCPCALPPEIVTSILSYMSYEELMGLRTALLAPAR
ncbi:ORF008 ankyrin repeat protein [Bovine papular stomatitis virus]|uniref:ORF008 ankyrin repeat protein n=1 Tax=Bovine papular stomatitis virus TaxID=129727 RepID=Q6TVI0_9POXV|nr:ankyrin-like protein [Bovine papular stomatitis virus]AAR98365.1 ORF008 ankyrin repeat protein [Bovine papular stomatitis virus]